MNRVGVLVVVTSSNIKIVVIREHFRQVEKLRNQLMIVILIKGHSLECTVYITEHTIWVLHLTILFKKST